jgi:hypothetical protein
LIDRQTDKKKNRQKGSQTDRKAEDDSQKYRLICGMLTDRQKIQTD